MRRARSISCSCEKRLLARFKASAASPRIFSRFGSLRRDGARQTSSLARVPSAVAMRAARALSGAPSSRVTRRPTSSGGRGRCAPNPDRTGFLHEVAGRHRRLQPHRHRQPLLAAFARQVAGSGIEEVLSPGVGQEPARSVGLHVFRVRRLDAPASGWVEQRTGRPGHRMRTGSRDRITADGLVGSKSS